MKLKVAAAILAFACIGSPALAYEGIVKKCFVKHYEGPQYKLSQHKIMDAKSRYEHRGGNRVDLVYYPAVYEERKTKTRDDRYVLRETSCR